MINTPIQPSSPVFVKTLGGEYINANNITKIESNKNKNRASDGEAVVNYIDYYTCNGSTKVFKQYVSAPVYQGELQQKLNIEI